MLKKIILILILVTTLPFLWLVFVDKNQVIEKSQSILSRIIIIKPEKEIYINNIDIIESTNKRRIQEGLTPFLVEKKLNKSAQLKVQDMIDRQYFEHQSPTGEGVSDLGNRVSYNYVVIGENLAVGNFINAEDIVEAWMNSPGHRENILNKNYQDIGVFAKQAMYNGTEVWFDVQHFGTNRSVCPAIDIFLKENIDIINNELKKEESDIRSLKNLLESPGASKEINYKNNISLFNYNVDQYNIKLRDSKDKISFYNIQVREFNKCIATFQ